MLLCGTAALLQPLQGYSPDDEFVDLRISIGSVGLPDSLMEAVTASYVFLDSQPRNWPQLHRSDP